MGKKSSKHSLDTQDLSDLQKLTSFSEEELQQWFQDFKKGELLCFIFHIFETQQSWLFGTDLSSELDKVNKLFLANKLLLK